MFDQSNFIKSMWAMNPGNPEFQSTVIDNMLKKQQAQWYGRQQQAALGLTGAQTNQAQSEADYKNALSKWLPTLKGLEAKNLSANIDQTKAEAQLKSIQAQRAQKTMDALSVIADAQRNATNPPTTAAELSARYNQPDFKNAANSLQASPLPVSDTQAAKLQNYFKSGSDGNSQAPQKSTPAFTGSPDEGSTTVEDWVKNVKAPMLARAAALNQPGVMQSPELMKMYNDALTTANSPPEVVSKIMTADYGRNKSNQDERVMLQRFYNTLSVYDQVLQHADDENFTYWANKLNVPSDPRQALGSLSADLAVYGNKLVGMPTNHFSNMMLKELNQMAANPTQYKSVQQKLLQTWRDRIAVAMFDLDRSDNYKERHKSYENYKSFSGLPDEASKLSTPELKLYLQYRKRYGAE